MPYEEYLNKYYIKDNNIYSLLDLDNFLQSNVYENTLGEQCILYSTSVNIIQKLKPKEWVYICEFIATGNTGLIDLQSLLRGNFSEEVICFPFKTFRYIKCLEDTDKVKDYYKCECKKCKMLNYLTRKEMYEHDKLHLDEEFKNE